MRSRRAAENKKNPLEQDLARISAVRNSPEHHDVAHELAPFLQHKNNHAISAAADAARVLDAEALVPDLISAFTSLMENPSKRDPGCKAGQAIAAALATFGADAAEVYLAGIRHVQMEGSFGPPVDVAAPLRGLCARGLIRMAHPGALFETIEVLADSQIAARVGAVRALGDSGSLAAELALRLKVLQGDDAEVMSECFTALLSLAPARSVRFVSNSLFGTSEEIIECAALALGESRMIDALAPLQKAYAAHGRRSLRKTFLLSIAMLRRDEAVKFLVACLREDPVSCAEDALSALELYQTDADLCENVAAIVASRESELLKRLHAERWLR